MLDLKSLTINIPERAVKALEQIAAALDRGFPIPAHLDPKYKKRDAGAVVSYGDNENLWNQEQLHSMAKSRGLSPATEAQLAAEMRNVTKDDLPPELR